LATTRPTSLTSSVAAIVALGIALRLALFVANRPDNAYDDHWTPIKLMVEQGAIPRVEDCWECGQPPLFYALGFLVFTICRPFMEIPEDLYSMEMLKAIQTLSFLSGAVTVVVGAMIILSAFHDRRAVLGGVALVALIPRHIYLSAMVANDALAALMATLAVLVIARADPAVPPSRLRLVGVGLLVGLAVLAKGTALALVPAVGAWLLWWSVRTRSMRVFATYTGIVLLSFVVGGGWVYVWRALEYGNPFIKNMEIFQFEQAEAYEGLRSFLPLPVTLLRVPLLDQVTAGSIPTQLYARTWFDYEPWLAGNASNLLPWARAAYLLGALPTILMLIGLWYMIRNVGEQPFGFFLAVLLLASVGLVVAHTISYRVYSSMKTTYLLPALASVAFAVSIGLQESMRKLPKPLRSGLSVMLIAAGVEFVVQILWIILSGPGHPGL
jgi:4-amino-4-deoxy-L-arabinose transferase-like glycosyltransferase